MTAKELALNGTLMGITVFLIASLNTVIWFIDFSTNEVSMLRIILLVPFFYFLSRVVMSLL